MAALSRINKSYHRMVALAERVKKAAFARPESGRLIVARREDALRDYVSEGLTPKRLTNLLHSFDAGELDAGMELFEQMEEKDSHLFSVANTRRMAFTGLPWKVVSAADIEEGWSSDRKQADAAADYCRQVLSRIEGLDEALSHLSLAIGRNLALCELVWEGSELTDIVPVPFTRLRYDTAADPPGLRVKTAENFSMGIPLLPNKWMVHAPLSPSGHPTRGGLLRLSAACYVAKGLALRDWLVFAELFGMPVRVGKYAPGATADDKRELLTMLQSLGSDAAGIFSQAVELQLVEVKSRGEGPYQNLASFFNAELSKAWVGQTLTTEQGDRGSQALGNVQNEVRMDIRDADMRSEARTIRRDLLGVLVTGKFGPDCPVPYWRREINVARDVAELTTTVVRSVNELGLLVDKGWFAAAAGLTLAEDAKDAIGGSRGRDQGTGNGGQGTSERQELREAAARLTVLQDAVSADQAEIDRLAEAAIGQSGEALSPLIDAIGGWIDELIDRGGSLEDLPELLADKIPTLSDEQVAELGELMRRQILASDLVGRAAAMRTMHHRGTEAQRRSEI